MPILHLGPPDARSSIVAIMQRFGRLRADGERPPESARIVSLAKPAA